MPLSRQDTQEKYVEETISYFADEGDEKSTSTSFTDERSVL